MPAADARDILNPLYSIDVPQSAYVDAMIGVYELNRIELLRDVFVWAYERSCQQYVAVKQNLVPPDIFRLRYRQALSEVVASIVKNNETATLATTNSSPNWCCKSLPLGRKGMAESVEAVFRGRFAHQP